MISERPPVNRVLVNAEEQDDHIESVTVFQANAEVKRRVFLELKEGQNHVDIERLPEGIIEDSIHVDGTGTATIFDVVYHGPPCGDSHNDPDDTAVSECAEILKALKDERDVARDQAGYLHSYGSTLNSKNTSADEMANFLDMFGSRQVAVKKRIRELDGQIVQAEKSLCEVRAQRRKGRCFSKRRTRITVTVQAEAASKAELLLTYVVSGATWTPLYDVRASIPSSRDVPYTVALHYRASITQTTGENWPNVKLVLSTASIQLGSAIPSLSTWRVGPRLPAKPWAKGAPPLRRPTSPASPAYSPASPAYSPYSEEDGSGGSEAMDLGDSSKPSPMTVRQANVVEAGGISATFSIPGYSTIPSDEGERKVVITVVEFPGGLEWVCVPRGEKAVFLRCNLVNSSEFTLLPGRGSVFVDNNFVAKTKIEYVSPNDSFQVSLGIDPGLRVSYPPTRMNKRVGGSGFGFLSKDSKQSVTSYSQRIIIRNSRAMSVSSLRILDHVPVSTDSNVKVDVLAPVGIGPITGESEATGGKRKERPWVDVERRVKARWAPPNVASDGVVEWACNIDPSEEVELQLGWEVSVPVEQEWETLR